MMTHRILQRIKKWSWRKKTASAIALLMLVLFCFALPHRLFNSPTSFYITDSDGNLLDASIAADGQWRFPYNEKVPYKFEKCIVAFEDKRFWYHPGIDPVAALRAAKQNFSGNKTISGGSTLSMQVIRLYKQNNKRTLWNKIIEGILAVRLEFSHHKKTILALYASNAPFGSNVVGLDAAAWRYFGRSAEQLSWGEMAALAILPNAPSLVRPGKNSGTLLRKRNALLDKLVTDQTIDRVTADLAKLEPLPGEPKPLPQYAPHLLDRFKKEYAASQTGMVSTGALTTIDGKLQQQVSMLVNLNHEQLKGEQVNNTAAMVMDIETGNILAYIGNVYEPQNIPLESHVDVLSAPRSPGSTLKPLLYASLLSEGTMLPTQLIPDVPTQIGGYTPQNFDLGYDGAVPADKALSRSLNIPAVKMLQQYKYQRFYDVLKQCGFTTLKQPADFYGMSLILGGCEVTPFELAGVYASMARMYLHQKKNKNEWNDKDWFMPGYISKKTKPENAKYKTRNAALFNYPSIWQTFNAMNEVMRPGEEGLWNLFSSAQRIAWKTGTSFGFRDGWAIGVTAKYCVVVWMGNTDGEGRPGLTGIHTAAPLLFDIFRLLPAATWFEKPADGFMYIPVCSRSGCKAGPDCAGSDTILVSVKASVAPVCPYCRIIHLDQTGTYRVNESCESPSDMQQRSWFVLPPTMEYYYRARHPSYQPLPAYKKGCTTDAAKTLDIIYPDEDAKIYIPLEITGEKGNVIFKATLRNTDGKLFWHLDDAFVASTQQFHQLSLNPSPGKHTITIIDKDGNSVTRRFEILQK